MFLVSRRPPSPRVLIKTQKSYLLHNSRKIGWLGWLGCLAGYNVLFYNEKILTTLIDEGWLEATLFNKPGG